MRRGAFDVLNAFVSPCLRIATERDEQLNQLRDFREMAEMRRRRGGRD
jgi:hypothetical protein